MLILVHFGVSTAKSQKLQRGGNQSNKLSMDPAAAWPVKMLILVHFCGSTAKAFGVSIGDQSWNGEEIDQIICQWILIPAPAWPVKSICYQ